MKPENKKFKNLTTIFKLCYLEECRMSCRMSFCNIWFLILTHVRAWVCFAYQAGYVLQFIQHTWSKCQSCRLLHKMQCYIDAFATWKYDSSHLPFSTCKNHERAERTARDARETEECCQGKFWKCGPVTWLRMFLNLTIKGK